MQTDGHIKTNPGVGFLVSLRNAGKRPGRLQCLVGHAHTDVPEAVLSGA